MADGQLWRQYVMAGIASIGIASIGYSMGWTAPVNVILRNETLTPLDDVITLNQEAWIGSVINLGAIVGPFLGGIAASNLGRKWGLLTASVPLLIGWILIAAATNVDFIYAGRVCWGVSLGMFFTITPMYCAEIATYVDIFKGSNFKAFYIACALLFFQQFSGINSTMFYLTNIFEAAGASLDPAIASIIVGAAQFLSSCITPLLVDRAGRRILMLISSIGSAIGVSLLGMYFILDENNSPVIDNIGFLPVLSLSVFIVSFCLGLGVLPWAIIGELMSVEVRAKAAPIATAFCWTLSFLVSRFFGPVADAAGMYTAFWIFGASCVASFVFCLFVLPETKGKSFLEIQALLAGKLQPEKTYEYIPENKKEGTLGIF